MTNAYENLYKNLKNSMTVVENSKEYNLAEYMLMQANKETVVEESTILPVAAKNYAAVGEKALSAVVSFVNDKLTIKEPPVKDKTIIAFPFRASASALLSAVACCALVLSIGIFGMSSMQENSDGIGMVDYSIEETVKSHTTLA